MVGCCVCFVLFCSFSLFFSSELPDHFIKACELTQIVPRTAKDIPEGEQPSRRVPEDKDFVRGTIEDTKVPAIESPQSESTLSVFQQNHVDDESSVDSSTSSSVGSYKKPPPQATGTIKKGESWELVDHGSFGSDVSSRFGTEFDIEKLANSLKRMEIQNFSGFKSRSGFAIIPNQSDPQDPGSRWTRRNLLMVYWQLPGGADVNSVHMRVSRTGRKVHIDTYLCHYMFDAFESLGPLCNKQEFLRAFQEVLDRKKAHQNGTNHPFASTHYHQEIQVPFKIERSFRDPNTLTKCDDGVYFVHNRQNGSTLVVAFAFEVQQEVRTGVPARFQRQTYSWNDRAQGVPPPNPTGNSPTNASTGSNNIPGFARARTNQGGNRNVRARVDDEGDEVSMEADQDL